MVILLLAVSQTGILVGTGMVIYTRTKAGEPQSGGFLVMFCATYFAPGV